MSGGVARAAKRLAEHREAQAARLAEAEGQVPSRQVIRQAMRRSVKMPVGMSQKEWHRRKGYFK